MASSDNSIGIPNGGPSNGADLTSSVARRVVKPLGAWRSDGAARWVFIWPTVLFILGLSIFPLVGSLALSFSKLVFTPGGVNLNFIGFTNYQQLIFGTERVHFLGLLKDPNPLGWAFVIAVGGLCAWWLIRAHRASGVSLLQ